MWFRSQPAVTPLTIYADHDPAIPISTRPVAYMAGNRQGFTTIDQGNDGSDFRSIHESYNMKGQQVTVLGFTRYHQCGCDKPVNRLWISSLEETAIREGFQHLHDSSEYDRLYEAALCRQKADWLVGINASRLYSLIYGTTLNIGRVMTPTQPGPIISMVYQLIQDDLFRAVTDVVHPSDPFHLIFCF